MKYILSLGLILFSNVAMGDTKTGAYGMICSNSNCMGLKLPKPKCKIKFVQNKVFISDCIIDNKVGIFIGLTEIEITIDQSE